MSRRSDAPLISNHALNRATLARQGLLAREAVSVEAMLGRLIGLQGQVPKAPHIGLWSRLTTFSTADLERLLTERRVVRATVMRVTLHVLLAEDFLMIRPLLDPVAMRGFRTNHLKTLKGADLDAIRVASRDLLAAEALTPQALGRKLQAYWPDVDPIALSMPARFLEPVVHVPPAGFWNVGKTPELTLARQWLEHDPGEPITLNALMLRYLEALGPASGNDFNTWSGLTGGAAAMERLRPKLVSFTTEDGREVFDLPEAPRPPADSPAPARLLPDYDSVIVGYAERSRILPAAHAKLLWRANGLRPAFTVDGFVRGTWKLTTGKADARLDLFSFAPLRRSDEAELRREGRAMLERLVPGHRPELVFSAFGEQ